MSLGRGQATGKGCAGGSAQYRGPALDRQWVGEVWGCRVREQRHRCGVLGPWLLPADRVTVPAKWIQRLDAGFPRSADAIWETPSKGSSRRFLILKYRVHNTLRIFVRSEKPRTVKSSRQVWARCGAVGRLCVGLDLEREKK